MPSEPWYGNALANTGPKVKSTMSDGNGGTYSFLEDGTTRYTVDTSRSVNPTASGSGVVDTNTSRYKTYDTTTLMPQYLDKGNGSTLYNSNINGEYADRLQNENRKRQLYVQQQEYNNLYNKAKEKNAQGIFEYYPDELARAILGINDALTLIESAKSSIQAISTAASSACSKHNAELANDHYLKERCGDANLSSKIQSSASSVSNSISSVTSAINNVTNKLSAFLQKAGIVDDVVNQANQIINSVNNSNAGYAGTPLISLLNDSSIVNGYQEIGEAKVGGGITIPVYSPSKRAQYSTEHLSQAALYKTGLMFENGVLNGLESLSDAALWLGAKCVELKYFPLTHFTSVGKAAMNNVYGFIQEDHTANLLKSQTNSGMGGYYERIVFDPLKNDGGLFKSGSKLIETATTSYLTGKIVKAVNFLGTMEQEATIGAKSLQSAEGAEVIEQGAVKGAQTAETAATEGTELAEKGSNSFINRLRSELPDTGKATKKTIDFSKGTSENMESRAKNNPGIDPEYNSTTSAVEELAENITGKVAEKVPVPGLNKDAGTIITDKMNLGTVEKDLVKKGVNMTTEAALGSVPEPVKAYTDIDGYLSSRVYDIPEAAAAAPGALNNVRNEIASAMNIDINNPDPRNANEPVNTTASGTSQDTHNLIP
ncbi:MAG: hypothetical protein IKJ43_01505 [Bacilli bacterium]|nr:hypothetical protein [Bacilli bacterium]